MSYFFSTPLDIDILLDDGDDRQMIDLKLEKNRRDKAPLYMDGESVKGGVTIRPKDGKRLEHTGIKVQFIGTIGSAHHFNTVASPTYKATKLTILLNDQKCFSIEALIMSSSP